MLKKKYTIYANCQGQALARVLNSSQAFREKYQYFQIKPVQEINLDYLNNFINSVIPQIDLFIFQPVSEKYKNYFRYSSKYITSHLKKDCRQLSFPSCYFQGYHPELRTLKDKNGTNISVPIYWNKKILHSTLVHDGNIIAGFCNRKSIIDIKNQFLYPDFYSKNFLESNLFKTLKTLSSRERTQNIDIGISLFMDNNFKGQRLYHTMNHPQKLVFQYLAECILDILQIEKDIKSIPDVLGHQTYPIYESTYKKLGLQFKNIPQYHIRQQSLEIEDVIKQYFEFYKTIPMEILRNNIRTYAVPLYMVHKFVFFKILSLQLVPLRKS